MKRLRYLLLAAVAMMCTAATAQTKNIAERQYWLDGTITEAQPLAESPTSVSIEGLKSGLHSLTVRVKDSEGLWSSQVAKYFIVPFVSTSVTSNSIEKHQYWIDGNLQAAVTYTSQPSAIVIDDLKPGLHSLTVRVQD
ncbi:MAG: hypothetical protein J6Z41_02070, partial [Prevotella sp.]|nr:hypothetical protein [Prevotella sp.]